MRERVAINTAVGAIPGVSACAAVDESTVLVL